MQMGRKECCNERTQTQDAAAKVKKHGIGINRNTQESKTEEAKVELYNPHHPILYLLADALISARYRLVGSEGRTGHEAFWREHSRERTCLNRAR